MHYFALQNIKYLFNEIIKKTPHVLTREEDIKTGKTDIKMQGVAEDCPRILRGRSPCFD